MSFISEPDALSNERIASKHRSTEKVSSIDRFIFPIFAVLPFQSYVFVKFLSNLVSSLRDIIRSDDLLSFAFTPGWPTNFDMIFAPSKQREYQNTFKSAKRMERTAELASTSEQLSAISVRGWQK